MSQILFEFLIAKSLGISVLLVLLLMIRPLVLRWLNARVAYQLWLLVPVFLLLPTHWLHVSVQSPVYTVFASASVQLPQFSAMTTLSESTVSDEILFIWLVGTGLSLACYLFSYSCLCKSFRFCDYQIPINIFTESNNKLRLPKIVSSPLIETPAVFGVFNPVLILPKNFDSLSATKQNMILRHELYHLTRHDSRINAMRAVLNCLFWFNPLCYLANRFIELDQEISCDLGVLQSSKTFNAAQYGRALLEESFRPETSPLLSQWNYPSLIKTRIKMLKTQKLKNWHNLIAVVFASILILVTGTVTGNEAEKSEDAIPTKIIYPGYPKQAAKNGIEGRVRFSFDLDEQGTPTRLKVVASKPEGVFDKSALKALAQWQFKVNDNKRTNLFYTMEFKLAEEAD